MNLDSGDPGLTAHIDQMHAQSLAWIAEQAGRLAPVLAGGQLPASVAGVAQAHIHDEAYNAWQTGTDIDSIIQSLSGYVATAVVRLAEMAVESANPTMIKGNAKLDFDPDVAPEWQADQLAREVRIKAMAVLLAWYAGEGHPVPPWRPGWRRRLADWLAPR